MKKISSVSVIIAAVSVLAVMASSVWSSEGISGYVKDSSIILPSGTAYAVLTELKLRLKRKGARCAPHNNVVIQRIVIS